MKKAYSKPEIVFENFSLTTNVAGDCEVKTNTASVGMCAYPYAPGMNIFLSDVAGCQLDNGGTVVTPGDDGTYNGMCYHVPIETNNLFNS